MPDPLGRVDEFFSEVRTRLLAGRREPSDTSLPDRFGDV
jgi:hypothetical protein